MWQDVSGKRGVMIVCGVVSLSCYPAKSAVVIARRLLLCYRISERKLGLLFAIVDSAIAS